MFVTYLDFLDNPYNLPKMNDSDTQVALQKFIDRNEANELRRILGGDLYNALVDGLTAGLPASWLQATPYIAGNQVTYNFDVYQALVDNQGVIPGTDPTKWGLQNRNRWQKIYFGEDFTNQNKAKENWAGLKEVIRPMVYAFWLRDELTTSVQGVGVIQQQPENSTNVTSAFRFSDALEAYSLKVGKLDGNERDTLYNYLYSNAGNFNDVGANIDNVGGNFVNYLAYYFCNPGFVNDFDF